MGACQLSQALASNLPCQEILSLPYDGSFSFRKRLWPNIFLVSLPWASNCHYTGNFIHEKGSEYYVMHDKDEQQILRTCKCRKSFTSFALKWLRLISFCCLSILAYPFFFFPPQMYSPYVCPYLCIVPSLEVCFVFGNCDFFTFQNWHSFVLDCCLRWCWHQNTTVRLPHLYSWIVCAEGFGACAGKHVLISFKMYFNFLINIVKGFVCIKWVIDHRVYI